MRPSSISRSARRKPRSSRPRHRSNRRRPAWSRVKSNRDLARVTADRWKTLVAQGVVSQQENDQYQAQLASQNANVQALEKAISAQRSNLAASQANLARLQDVQGYRIVKAPFDGVITLRNVDVGALVSTGTTLLYRIAQTGTLRTYVNVPQANASSIHVGQPAQLTLSNFPGRRFAGTVARTANALDPSSRTMLVEVDVPNADGALFPGMYAEVDLSSARLNPPLLVPAQALIIRSDGAQVAVVQPDGSVHLQKVDDRARLRRSRRDRSGRDGGHNYRRRSRGCRSRRRQDRSCKQCEGRMRSSNARLLGIAGAALWLVAVSAGFTILSLVMIGSSAARFVLVGVVIAAMAYVVIGVGMIRTIRRIPAAISTRTPEERVILRRFVYVVIGEVVAIMVVNAVCAITQHLELLVPLDVLIVGIHFLPLASLFRVPRYYPMGGLFCLVSVLTLVLVPAHAQVGAAAAWFVLPALGCTPVAWVTAAYNLREARQFIHQAQSAAA